MEFQRDPSDWLRKFSPDEWIRAAMGELSRAEAALKSHDGRAAFAGCKRAAGMALNAALLCEPNSDWGRSYVEHVSALARDASVPTPVREAASIVMAAHAPADGLVLLRAPSSNERTLEAVRNVIAHAYAVVRRHESA